MKRLRLWRYSGSNCGPRGLLSLQRDIAVAHHPHERRCNSRHRESLAAGGRSRGRPQASGISPGRDQGSETREPVPSTDEAHRQMTRKDDQAHGRATDKRSRRPVPESGGWPLTCDNMVELIAHYSNTPELLSDLRRTVDAVTTVVVEDDEPDLSSSAPADRDWRVSDRLSPSDINQLVESFKDGTTISNLVTRYGISRSSVKTLLRQRGVRRSRRSGPG